MLWVVMEEDATRQLRVPRKQLELGPQTQLQKFVVTAVAIARVEGHKLSAPQPA